MIGKKINEEHQKREIEREVQNQEFVLYSHHQESLIAQAQVSNQVKTQHQKQA
jgi:hypothetical protein